MKWNLDDLPVFLAIIERGGISAAANTLGMPKSTVSTTLTRLEQDLGLRLIDRSSRSLRITAEGEVFYRQAQQIIEQAVATDSLMADLGSIAKGRLKVALPPAFSEEFVASHLLDFRQQYPEIDLEIVITSQGAELIRNHVDIAVVVGELEDSELVSLPLIRGQLIWVSSSAWLSQNRLPETLDELGASVQVCETRYALRRLPVYFDKDVHYLDLSHGVIRVNHPLIVRRMLLLGGGVSMLPQHYCVKQLAEKSLIQISPHLKLKLSSSQLTAIYSSRRLISPRIRVFLEFLKEICKD
ncbi:LysR family transcriptional regulator [Acinetobacter sp. ANC 4635]|uniref:LysR family transcriptional regulator n=1 Tax=Acinetobacter sp. ANC 4635 TaxID=2529846 RepID=UPI00103CFFE4|nr:LysR family transcriptional regulator [Acinetobacter sp. ANC 4635]TCB26266.1 LysR family transcriptional regulator [Acinetobacter sp. ANC 4635]